MALSAAYAALACIGCVGYWPYRDNAPPDKRVPADQMTA